jgi:glyoxylase-like metal-dependent hydrolase (beta-lactamase superfamily II)
MTRRLTAHLLTVGSCRHFERLAMRGGRWRPVTFPSLSALLLHPERGPLLYDTGYARHFTTVTQPFPERFYRWLTPVTLPPEQVLEAQLGRFGLTTADIRTVIVSHFHGDHVAGLRDLPNARFVCLRTDREALRSAPRVRALRRGMLPALLPPDFDGRCDFVDDCPVHPIGSAFRELSPGFDLLGDGSLLGVPLPGHTSGQLGLWLRDQRDRELLLCADAAWSLRAIQEHRLPAFPARLLMHDWQQYAATMRRLQNLANAHPEIVLLPSHCADSIARYREGQ